ncbi:hypothetical protein EJ05DRAFT_476354 [Pseudovirgaria hyperparasitica]|uniref:Uncharacterized protein n=1 Tax=Pseudovirgaria hyperparasitica TaxID=470096 RepID=A0A6A6W880_9PEZI|nr:uncharacterized protein EJ05DRAFT_476354 [Pseudovirgaria hyperparasitica]KAF2758096.1 hypothetical protein EJ05DRAFT_476354 [Pseudovirgaria hyperparasitica]
MDFLKKGLASFTNKSGSSSTNNPQAGTGQAGQKDDYVDKGKSPAFTHSTRIH